MPRQTRSNLASAISYALKLQPQHPLFVVAKGIVIQANDTCDTSKEARAQIGDISPHTWTSWKRRIGLEVKVTNPGGKRAQ